MYDLWSSYAIEYPGFHTNYNNIHDPIWDEYVKAIKFAPTIEDAETNAMLAQQRFVDQAFFIPLWAASGYFAHNKDWHVLNVDTYGVRDKWNLYCANKPSVGPVGGTLNWGFAADVMQLNVIYSNWLSDWQILNEIFDSLIVYNPSHISTDHPWMCSAYSPWGGMPWKIETWTHPDSGLLASKISFNLKTGMKWVDSLTGAIIGNVTPEDVRFSFQYVYDHGCWNFPSVADIYVNPNGTLKIEINGNII